MYQEQTGSTPTFFDQFFDCGELGTVDVFSDVFDVRPKPVQSFDRPRGHDYGGELASAGNPDLLACAGTFHEFRKLLLGFK
jgi:hypothetical protein